jgi:fructokinase
MRPKRCVSFGEALIDRYPDHEDVAGAPLHVAVHLARAGWESWLVTRVGRDPAGERIREVLRGHGVRLDLVEIDEDRPSGTVRILPAGDGHQDFDIARDVAWDAISGPSRLPEHDVLYFGTLAARDPTSWAALQRLLQRSSARLVVLDVNFRPPDVRPEALELGLARARLVKMNEDEARETAGRFGFASFPSDCFDRFRNLEWLCVTKGARGAELFARGGGTWRVDLVVERAAESTVGAGDAFTAGLIEGLVDGGKPQGALESAIRRAAEVVHLPGSLPPPSAGDQEMGAKTGRGSSS